MLCDYSLSQTQPKQHHHYACETLPNPYDLEDLSRCATFRLTIFTTTLLMLQQIDICHCLSWRHILVPPFGVGLSVLLYKGSWENHMHWAEFIGPTIFTMVLTKRSNEKEEECPNLRWFGKNINILGVLNVGQRLEKRSGSNVSELKAEMKGKNTYLDLRLPGGKCLLRNQPCLLFWSPPLLRPIHQKNIYHSRAHGGLTGILW